MSFVPSSLIVHALSAYLAGVLIGVSGWLPTPSAPDLNPATTLSPAGAGPAHGR